MVTAFVLGHSSFWIERGHRLVSWCVFLESAEGIHGVQHSLHAFAAAVIGPSSFAGL